MDYLAGLVIGLKAISTTSKKASGIISCSVGSAISLTSLASDLSVQSATLACNPAHEFVVDELINSVACLVQLQDPGITEIKMCNISG